jgi:hypothetical protein
LRPDLYATDTSNPVDEVEGARGEYSPATLLAHAPDAVLLNRLASPQS